MKFAHYAKLTVFCHEGENFGNIKNALLEIVPFSLEQNKLKINETNATGFSEKKIKILEINLQKESLISKFLKNLSSNLSEIQKGIILQQLESRLDDGLHFFIRLDKEKWLNQRKLLLTDSGRCFHIKISMAAFPHKREIALKMLTDFFSK